MPRLPSQGVDPWSCARPKKFHDIRRLDCNFETIQEAKAERQHRIRVLRGDPNPEFQELADALEACTPGDRCRSSACPLCFRQTRLYHAGEAMRILQPSGKLIFVTLISSKDAIPADLLNEVQPKRLHNTLRQRLRRAGLGDELIIGGLDGVFEVKYGFYQLHHHLLAPASCKAKFLELAEQHYPKADTIYRPVMVKVVDELAPLASYIAKGHWMAKIRFPGKDGREKAQHRRIPDPLLRKWLLWRDQYAPSEFLFLQGARQCGCRWRRIELSSSSGGKVGKELLNEAQDAANWP